MTAESHSFPDKQHLTAALLALPTTVEGAPVVLDIAEADAAFQTLQDHNPHLTDLVDRQVAALRPAIQNLITQFEQEGPTTDANRGDRNNKIFGTIARMSVTSALFAVGTGNRSSVETALEFERLWNAPATGEPTIGASDDDVDQKPAT